MSKHGGKVLIQDKFMLDILGYPGGKLHYLGRAEDYLGNVAVIEHDNLPEVNEGEPVQVVNIPTVFWNIKDYYTLRVIPTNFLGRIKTCLNAFIYAWNLCGYVKTHSS